MKEIRIKLPSEYNCETNNNIITEIKNGDTEISILKERFLIWMNGILAVWMRFCYLKVQ